MSHAKNSFLDISIKEKQDLTTSLYPWEIPMLQLLLSTDTGVYFLQQIDCDQNW